jgi:hypothetical protein
LVDSGSSNRSNEDRVITGLADQLNLPNALRVRRLKIVCGQIAGFSEQKIDTLCRGAGHARLATILAPHDKPIVRRIRLRVFATGSACPFLEAALCRLGRSNPQLPKLDRRSVVMVLQPDMATPLACGIFQTGDLGAIELDGEGCPSRGDLE